MRHGDLNILKVFVLRPEVPRLAADIERLAFAKPAAVYRSLEKLRRVGLIVKHGPNHIFAASIIGEMYGHRTGLTPERFAGAFPYIRDRHSPLDLRLARWFFGDPDTRWTAAELALFTSRSRPAVLRMLTALCEVHFLSQDEAARAANPKHPVRFTLHPEISMPLVSAKRRLIDNLKTITGKTNAEHE